ncbi:MAG TPA: TadE/TadG family type IV pilus assembly protein [Candidatus Binatia bacterium]
MAILLWDLIIAAAFVLVAVGALAYVLADLVVAAIHKAAGKKITGLISAHIPKRPQRQPGHRLRARFSSIVFQKFICSLSAFKRAARKNLARKASGQALVEFTLMFVLFLAIIWIPVDFGLAFYSGQLAQNASREGARLAAATNPFDAGNIQTQVMNRMDSAVLKNVTADVVPPACDGALNMQVVTVTVAGEYNFYFYQLLRLLGLSAPDSVFISRTTTMRYEYGFTC